ncbi:MAG: GTP-binding protein [Magnetococcales bacterium]|nr:GTP-binding protein [Magnetococcales bacterium]
MNRHSGQKALNALLVLGEKSRQAVMQGWQWGQEQAGRVFNSTAPPSPEPGQRGNNHLDMARQSLRELVEDGLIPESVRRSLSQEFEELVVLLRRLDEQEIHVVVCGRVSVGKSALLNALLGRDAFSVSPLHGETRSVHKEVWQQVATAGVVLIDTPGLDEPDGEEREELARQAANRGDMILFVIEGDITESEFRTLAALTRINRPVILVLNKADRYTQKELEQLQGALSQRLTGLANPPPLVVCSARPGEKIYVEVGVDGREREIRRRPSPDVAELLHKLWDILEAEGLTLAAMNASLFASDVSDQVAKKIVEYRQQAANKVIHGYCIGKGVATAFNPVPVSDLVAVLAADAALIVHLGRIYGLPLTMVEAGRLLAVIAGQLTLLMGTVWGTHLLSSALKGISGGLSSVVTAGAQGAVAYYGTLVIGQAAQRYFAQGRSWGEGGPKQTIQEILNSLDRQSILRQGREEIMARIRSGGKVT